MRTTFVSSLFLALVSLAFAIPEHARVFINAQTPKGVIEVVVFEGDLCIIRQADQQPPDAWSAIMPLSALNVLTPANGDAIAGVSLCAKKPVLGGSGGGAPQLLGWAYKEIDILEHGENLEAAVSKAHDALVDALSDGWVAAPCPPSGS